ncbi:unnamed protein product [Chironomus riparius]|uniref:Fatty acid hydroxylase domain-containing protein n=1 Tax=Chironomus riparius TaxID=315576 RepID=A0A9N9WMX2_9DIPT|nr:unnamed protein product [Chironomus riparius]
MKQLERILSYINPFFFYYSVIYGISKVYETSFHTESVWQMCWDRTRETFGDDKRTYIIWGLNAYTTILYWTLGFIIIIMERMKRPKVLDNYKIQANTNETENNEKLIKVVRVVFRNQGVALIISMVAYKLDNNFLGISISPELPTFFITMRDLLICFFSQEIFFYYSHRMLHYKRFYWLHKQHHEFIAPIAIAAEYCGVVEHILSNLLPVVIGFKFVNAHVTTAVLWLTIVIVTTLSDHSGYHLPFMHSSRLHDYHHLKFNVNYSVYGFLDKLHGTYGHFETSKSYKNHRTLFSLSPLKDD